MQQLALGLLVAAMAAGAAAVGQKSYRACKLTNGQIFSCEGAGTRARRVVYTDR